MVMNNSIVKRHAKIVCTLGPASSSAEIIEGVLKGGMDVARFNLAHGTFEEHSRAFPKFACLARSSISPQVSFSTSPD